MTNLPRTHETSVTTSGMPGSAPAWLDVHFQACQPEYEAMLRSAGIRRDWRILDAGCGAGSFLPLMADLVGPHGRIDAVDLTRENIARVEDAIVRGAYACTTAPRVGDLLDLPYPPATFDAVWNANVTQYFADDDCRRMVAELCRVVKTGGIVAVKELDSSAFIIHPAPALLWWRLFAALVAGGSVQDAGMLRALGLHRFLNEAGLVHVTRKVFFVERYAPLRRVEHAFLANLMEYNLADVAAADLAPADRALWQQLCDPASPHYLPDQPDLYWREAHVLVTGIKPD